MRPGPRETELIAEAVVVETVYVLPADAVQPDHNAMAPWAKHISPIASVLGFVIRLVYFAIAPFFLAMFCYMGDHTALTVLVATTFLFSGVIGRTPWLTEKCPWLLRIPLVRDALEVLNGLHAFYFEHRPRWFLFYLFYPVSALFFIFSRTVRREFRLWAGIFGSVLAAIVGEAVVTYSSTYPPHLGPSVAIINVMFRILLCMLVFVGFFMPVATTSYTYHLSHTPWRMRLLVVAGLVSASPMIYVLSSATPFWPHMLLSARVRTPTFRAELKRSTEMFLRFEGPRLEEVKQSGPEIHAELTEAYRRHIAGLAPHGEARFFEVLTVPTEPSQPGRPWLAVRITNDRALVAVMDPTGRYYTSWEDLPAAIRVQFNLIPGTARREQADTLSKTEMIDEMR